MAAVQPPSPSPSRPSDLMEWIKSEVVPEGLEFRMGNENRVFVRVKPEDVDMLAERFIRKYGVRIIHVTGVDLGIPGSDIVYLYDFSKQRERLVIALEANVPPERPEVPSVARVTWQASWAEREMMEFLGVTALNAPDTRHQFLPFEWPQPAESQTKQQASTVMKPAPGAGAVPGEEKWLPVGIRDAYSSLIPIGPYHPGVIEGQIVQVKVEGESVVDADIKTGFHHRGIQRLIERRGYNKGVFTAERVCGICSGAHGLAYVTAVENLYGAEVPERARYIRTLLVELNRVHSHLLWLGVVSDVIGFKTGFMLTWGIRERIMDIIEEITGNRVNYGIWRLGGVSRDVSQELAQRVRSIVKGVGDEAKPLLLDVAAHPVLRSRLVGVGRLSYAQAFNGGAVGPVARASNWKIDVRMDNPPHAVYDPAKISWEVITEDGCDTMARTLVRVRELFVSIGIIDQCLDYLSKTTGEVRIKPREIPENAEGIGLNEAPRGELAYYIRAGEGNLPQAVRIRTPSYRNNALIPFMLIGSNLADVPVIMGSTDQCLACTDRFEVIDTKTERVCQLTWDDLVCLSRKSSGGA